MYVLLEIDATSGKTNTLNFTNLEQLQSFVNSKSNKTNPTLLKNEIIAKIEYLFESLQNTLPINNNISPSIIIQEKHEIDKDEIDKDEIDKDDKIEVNLINCSEDKIEETSKDIEKCLSKLGDNFGIGDVIQSLSQNNIGTKKVSYCDIREDFFQPAKSIQKPIIPEETLEKLLPNPDSLKKTIENDYCVYNILESQNFSKTKKVIPENLTIALNQFCKFFIDNYCKESIGDSNYHSNNTLRYCLILLSRYTNKIIENETLLRTYYLGITKLDFEKNHEKYITYNILFDYLSSSINCSNVFSKIDNTKIFQQYFYVLNNLITIAKKYHISSLYEYLIELIVFKISAKMYDNLNGEFNNYFSEVIPYLVDLYFEAKIITEKGKSIQSSDLFSDFNLFLSELFENAPEYFEFYKSQYNAKVFGKLVKEKNITSIRKSSGIFYSDIIYKNTPSSSLTKLTSSNPDAYNCNSFDCFDTFEYVPKPYCKVKSTTIKNPARSII